MVGGSTLRDGERCETNGLDLYCGMNDVGVGCARKDIWGELNKNYGA